MDMSCQTQKEKDMIKEQNQCKAKWQREGEILIGV